MKLFTKYTRINTTFTVAIFLVGAMVFYFVLRYVLLSQLDETLLSEEQEIEAFVLEHNRLPEIENTRTQWIDIASVEGSSESVRQHFRTITKYKKAEHEHEQIRQLIFPLSVGDKAYRVTVNKSEVEEEDLLGLLVPLVLALVGLVLATGLVLNRTVVRRLWSPFYSTLDHIRKYRISDLNPLSLSKSPIDEITLLNETLNEMTQRVYRDYTKLQEFTGNAAHEMQTPLTVIRSKLERLTQLVQHDEQLLNHLTEVDEAATKLSQLHQSLLLLTRLENNQFLMNQNVRLDSVLDVQIRTHKEIIESKHFSLDAATSQVEIKFHEQLAEILISNLLSNACRYTPVGGKISVVLSSRLLVICNTPLHGELDPEKVFERFYKNSPDGAGLGLAISREIVRLAGFSIQYHFKDGLHQFMVDFGEKENR